MVEVIISRIRELERENDRLRNELAMVIAERDEWKDRAVEISHMLTYTAERLNHRDLHLIKG